jgi:hypothetical protein
MSRIPIAGRLSRLPVALGLFAMLLLAGCATSIDATSLGVPTALSSAAAQRPTGEAFKVTTHAVFGFWGLASIKKPAVAKVLASQLAGNKAISDVRIRIRSRWSDVLVTILTGGLVVPRSVTVEGVVVAQ